MAAVGDLLRRARLRDSGELVEGRYAVCPLHNYQFEPATGKARHVTCRKARTYRARESGDTCEVWL